MRTSIRALIRESGHKIEDTVYREETNEILDFKLTAGDFFEIQKGLEKGRNYEVIDSFYRLFRKKQEEKEVPQWLELLGELNRLAVVTKENRGDFAKENMERLKKAKRYVRKKMNDCVTKAYEETVEEMGENREELLYFEYKNRAVMTSFSNITRIIPELKRITLDELYQIPVLATGLGEIRAAVLEGESIGVVGGPCLFGVDEVLLQVTTKDGAEKYFDCSGGRNSEKQETQRQETLQGYLSSRQGEIANIRIINRKTGITRQEHRSLLYLFEIAKALGGKVVIPLPDMSYLKYMESDLISLKPSLLKKAMEIFAEEVHRIRELFLEAIGVMKQRYSGLEVTVLHLGDHELCETFYREREPFIRDSSYMRKLTGVNGKKEAVVDYITMLALPYYLYRTKNIIQVDSLDETDSGRKCQKIHKGNFMLHSLLYPEFISRDGIHTIYHADHTCKEYLKKEEY